MMGAEPTVQKMF